MGHQHEFDPSSWPFDVRIDTAVFTTRQVMEHGLPILEVHHDSEGDWQFLCATTRAADDLKLVCLGCMMSRDPTLAQVADLSFGGSAFRSSPSDPWTRAEADAREVTVGVWGRGAFESDRAADWLMRFDGASPAAQRELLAQTFARVGRGGGSDLDVCLDVMAAASALIAFDEMDALQARSTGATTASGHPAGLRVAAIDAMHEVARPDSEWSELWRESGHLDAVLNDVDRLVATLQPFDDWAPHRRLEAAANAYLRDPDLAVEALKGVTDLDAVQGFVLERVTVRHAWGVTLYQEIVLTDGERLVVWMGDDVVADEDTDEPGLALFQSQVRVIPLTWVYDVVVEANYRAEHHRKTLHSSELRVFVGAQDYATIRESERTDIYNHELRFAKSRHDGGQEQALRLLEFGRLVASGSH